MRVPIIAACLLAGLAAAFALTASATGPVTLPDLPGLGYSLSMQFDVQTQCGNYVVVSGNGVDHEILIGDLPPSCSTAAQEAGRIAALLADFPPPGQAPVTTTVYETTTAFVTTAVDPLPAVTVATPPEVHTLTETVTQTVTVAAAPVDVVAPWMTALAVRSQGMNDVFGLA